VTKLLKTNPFPDHPPKYVRAMVYDYHFTTSEERKATGNWWKRDSERTYIPAISKEDFANTM
jgi:hypothetical protein